MAGEACITCVAAADIGIVIVNVLDIIQQHPAERPGPFVER